MFQEPLGVIKVTFDEIPYDTKAQIKFLLSTIIVLVISLLIYIYVTIIDKVVQRVIELRKYVPYESLV